MQPFPARNRDGSIWVCYDSEAIEITDRFNEDGVCYVQFETDRGTRYLTIKYQGDFVSSRDGYVPPESIGTGDRFKKFFPMQGGNFTWCEISPFRFSLTCAAEKIKNAYFVCTGQN